jgi:exopolysaccharide biosynthesis polyprenyl glycosylphosphotransferase
VKRVGRSLTGESPETEFEVDLRGRQEFPQTVAAAPEDGRRRRRPTWMIITALAVTDAGGLTLCFLLASTFGDISTTERGTLMLAFACSLPLCLLAFRGSGLYAGDSARVNHSTLDEAGDVARVVALCAAVFLVAVWATGIAPPRIGTVFGFWAMAAVLVPTLRGLARIPLRRDPALRHRTVIVGAGTVGQLLGKKLLQHPEYGVEMLGFVDSLPKERRDDLQHLVVLGAPSDLPALVSSLGVDRVIFAFSNDSHEGLAQAIRLLKDYDVQVEIVPRLFDVIPLGVAGNTIEGIPLISLPRLRLSRISLFLKRSFDLVVTALLLVLLAPLLGLIALLIKVDSPGPVFFRQTRMGTNDATFTIFKYRTMVSDADQLKERLAHLNTHAAPGGDPRMFKVAGDPRVTRVGHVLRALSLDELPQLLNVIRGDMSLIGPRPLILEEDRHVQSWGRRRLALKPGMTGLWQVSGRSAIPFEEMVKLDYLYVTNWSLAEDCRILLHTLPLVFRRSGY